MGIDIGGARVPKPTTTEARNMGIEIGTLQHPGAERRMVLPDPGKNLLHMLLSGQTGSGKSTTGTRITTRFAFRGDAAIVGADPKGGMELGPWAPRLTSFAVSKDEITSESGRVLETVHARADLLQSVAKLEGSSVRFWETRMGPWLLFVADEIAELRPQPGERGGMLALERLASIAALGRAVGVTILAMTQYALKSDFPGRLLTNLPTRICHRMGTPTEYMVALSVSKTLLEASGWRPITLDERGMFYITGAPGVPDMSKGKSTYMRDEMIPTVAERTAHLRWRPEQVYSVPTADWVVNNYPRGGYAQ